MNRREAIKRTALLLGLPLASSTFTCALARAADTTVDSTKPRFLSPHQFDTLSAIADRLLPKTKTPGALDVGVPDFADICYGEYMSPNEQTSFKTGLSEFNARSQTKYGRSFSHLTSSQQDALITDLSKDADPEVSSNYRKIRDVVFTGFYTSEEIGKNVFLYDPIPGGYNGCYPLEKTGGKSWTN